MNGHELEQEAPPLTQRLTEDEAKAIIALWAARQDADAFNSLPRVEDVAGGLGIPADEVRVLLREVRARQAAEEAGREEEARRRVVEEQARRAHALAQTEARRQLLEQQTREALAERALLEARRARAEAERQLAEAERAARQAAEQPVDAPAVQSYEPAWSGTSFFASRQTCTAEEDRVRDMVRMFLVLLTVLIVIATFTAAMMATPPTPPPMALPSTPPPSPFTAPAPPESVFHMDGPNGGITLRGAAADRFMREHLGR